MKQASSIFLVALVSCPASVVAQPSFDCTEASSEAEKLVCADDKLAKLDQRLSETYRTAVSVAEALDAGAYAALKKLRASQRGWIKGRDECWKALDLSACVETSYLMREGELVAYWILREPTAITAYFCEENRANEVTAYFFDTELPSIRLEYGDGIKTGSLLPSASGAKYMTDFGGMFWTKGDSAQFAWTEGEVMTCVRSE